VSFLVPASLLIMTTVPVAPIRVIRGTAGS
jgi:hypothetical protein